MSDLDRWKQMCDELNACCNELKADLMQADDVIFQQAVENERLKSELRKKAIDAISDIGQLGEQSAEINHLKAEVERLRIQVGTDAIDREHGMCCDSSAENARLKAEVERLTNCKAEADYLKAEVERLRKAGDAMASCIQFNEEMEQDYEGPTIVRQCVKDWNAAKEGKLDA